MHKDLIDGDAMGIKEWSCDIAVIASADDGVLWHEMLHSCSCSYYDSAVYYKNQIIEEASVEFLKQSVCEDRKIKNIKGYTDEVMILQVLNSQFCYGSDLEFAKELFNIPLPERYQWLENKAEESLRNCNASFEDFNEVLKFVQLLKGALDDI